MRGPDYYYALTRPWEDISIRSFILCAQRFIDSGKAVAFSLKQEEPDFPRFKRLAALLDNTQNFLLIMQYAAYMSERKNQRTDFQCTSRLFRELLVPHTRVHFDLFLNPDISWEEIIDRYPLLLDSLSKLAPSLERAAARLSLKDQADLIRRWRECDHFLENVTAVQLGLNQLRTQTKALDRSLVTVGLVYGATELPAIATVVARALHFGLTGSYCDLSVYRDRSRGHAVRKGGAEYVKELRGISEPIFIEGGAAETKGRRVILLDDNCVTGVTMQTARDMFIYQGAEVIGAIVVRYPGANRNAQMAMRGHGYVDPEMLFSFIRGLVVPSPYVRLLYERKGAERRRYLIDKFGIFDKSRERIKVHLAKNGTPPIND